MANVTIISTTIVRPDNYQDQSGRVKIHLTPFDLFFLRTELAQRGLLFPKPDPETQFISRLKSSLSLTLNHFYPFAGRLVKVDNGDETASFYVDCNGSGVKFIHAEAKTVSVTDVVEPLDRNVPEFLTSFFPANRVRCCEGVSESLLVFQVTELNDGIFIGFGYNHMVADGNSFWSFFNTWSENCFKGFNSDHRKDSPPLVLRRWFLDGIDYPIRIPISETEMGPKIPITPSSEPNLQEKIFRFTKETALKLKAKANGEVSSDDQKISSLQSIAAHMWQSVIRNSDLNPDESTNCIVIMDMRRRLNPPLEKESFGNVVGFATATTTVRELLNRGLGWVGLQINKSVGLQTNEKFKVFAENWVKERKIPRALAVSNSIGVASSPWFNVYGNDFGWGKPVAVRAARGANSNGKLVAYPGIEQGNIEIQTCLPSHIIEKLMTDAEFLQHVCLV